MPTKSTMTVPFGQTPEGVEAAEDYTERCMTHFIDAADIARLDLTVVSLFALSEILARLEYHTGMTAEAAVREVKQYTEDRVDFLRAEHESCPDQTESEARAAVLH